MVNLSFKKSEFSYEHKRILKETIIMERGPGTILRDFNVILNYLKEKDLPVSGTHQFPSDLKRAMVSGLRAALKAAYLAGESPAPGLAYLPG